MLSLLSYVKAENSAFPLAIPDASAGTNLAATTPATLAASGFLARAEFETVADGNGSRVFDLVSSRSRLRKAAHRKTNLPRRVKSVSTPRRLPISTATGPLAFRYFIAFASKFGTQRGDAAFDARFDLDGDGEPGSRISSRLPAGSGQPWDRRRRPATPI